MVSPKKLARNILALGVATAVGLAPALNGASANAAPPRPWMNTALTASQRADKLLSAMTLEQKVHMLHGRLLTKKETAAVGYIPAIPELGVPEFVQSDGPLGVRNWEDKATAFPSPIGYAASWSPAIAALEGRIAGEDALALGTDAIYGPGLNMARNPEAGRPFEYFGEDPFLTGSMTAANVKGMQSTGVIATLKHYVANNQETSRHLGESRVPSRALREIYMKPYKLPSKKHDPDPSCAPTTPLTESTVAAATLPSYKNCATAWDLMATLLPTSLPSGPPLTLRTASTLRCPACS